MSIIEDLSRKFRMECAARGCVSLGINWRGHSSVYAAFNKGETNQYWTIDADVRVPEGSSNERRLSLILAELIRGLDQKVGPAVIDRKEALRRAIGLLSVVIAEHERAEAQEREGNRDNRTTAEFACVRHAAEEALSGVAKAIVGLSYGTFLRPMATECEGAVSLLRSARGCGCESPQDRARVARTVRALIAHYRESPDEFLLA